jgi:Zn-dependent M16 (insulinase) family peptidase
MSNYTSFIEWPRFERIFICFQRRNSILNGFPFLVTINYLDTYVQKLTAVTPKDVQDMAAKYLTEDKMSIVVVGDKSKITEQLKPYEK